MAGTYMLLLINPEEIEVGVPFGVDDARSHAEQARLCSYPGPGFCLVVRADFFVVLAINAIGISVCRIVANPDLEPNHLHICVYTSELLWRVPPVRPLPSVDRDPIPCRRLFKADCSIVIADDSQAGALAHGIGMQG